MTVKRSEFKTFLNTGTTLVPIWSLVGDGVTSAKISYNPETTKEVFIHQNSGTTEIESYAPNMPIEAKAKDGDAVFDYVDAMRRRRAVLDDAKTEAVNVWLWDTPVSGEYPAEKQQVSIQWEDFGGDGGKAAMGNFTINFIGDPILGTFDPEAAAFTATP